MCVASSSVGDMHEVEYYDPASGGESVCAWANSSIEMLCASINVHFCFTLTYIPTYLQVITNLMTTRSLLSPQGVGNLQPVSWDMYDHGDVHHIQNT